MIANATLETARTETDNSSGSTVETVVSFEYDARDRLIRETRVRQGSPDVTEYEIAYAYDGLGNRLSKTQTTATEGDPLTVETVYDYDVEGTEAFETNNNRLLEYNEYVDEEVTRTVSYVYYKTGHASNIIVKDAGDEVYRGLALYYTRTGRLWLAIWEQWELDEYEEVTNYAATAAREFMYDSGRARYLARDVDPETFEPEGAQRWSDYDGDEPYGDFAVTIGQQGAAVIDESMRYLNGGGTLAQQTVVEGQGDELDYLHGDLIRSTVATTDADGQNGAYSGPPVTVAYTAFGEIVTRDGSGNVTIGSAAPAGFPRYQYAGGWGYESGSADASDTSGMLTLNGAEGTSPIRLMHVGERWYQPDIGRFVMRDPMGVALGLNCYDFRGGMADDDVKVKIEVGVEGEIGIPGMAKVKIHVNVTVEADKEDVVDATRIAADVAHQVSAEMADQVAKELAKLPQRVSTVQRVLTAPVCQLAKLLMIPPSPSPLTPWMPSPAEYPITVP